MKTYLTYGFGIALGGAIISMVLYFLGFNADPDKLQASRWITMVIGIVIAIVGLYLGTKEKRALTPPDKPWGYGSAFGAAFMIGLFAAIFSGLYNYAYFAFIDPGISDIILQMQLDQMEAKGMSADQIDKIEPMVRKWINPVAMSISGFVGAFFFHVVIGLVVAAFVKSRPQTEPPIAAV